MRRARRPDESTTGRHVPALDGVRGIAIVLVLFMHLYTRHHAAASPPVEFLYSCINTTWIGVDLFFVLSGFLITGILHDTLPDRHFFRNFYARRALRIFPLYYLNLAIVLGAFALAGAHWYLRPVLLLVAHMSTLFQAGPPSDSPAANLGLSLLWSLNVEEQFYLFWPLTIFLLRTPRRIILGALVGVGCSFALRVWTYLAGHSIDSLYTWAPTRLDGLLLGGALAMVLRTRYRAEVLRWSTPLLAFGNMSLLIAISLEHGLSSHADPWVDTIGYTLLAVLGCGLVGSALRDGSVAHRLCTSAPLRLFGRYSYFLYLSHFTLRLVIQEPLYNLLYAWGPTRHLATWIAPTLLVAVLLAAAAFSFRYFEQPILQWKRYFSAHSSRPKLQTEVQMAEMQESPIEVR